MIKRFFSFGLLLFAFVFCSAQDDWKLKSDKDGIKSYSRRSADSKLNSIKVESDFLASSSRFVSVILDVASYDDWIYGSKSTHLVKQVSATELYYYSEVKFPWPAVNRDFVSHITVNQDAHSKIITINATNVSGWEPLKENIVRIERSVAKWIIKPKGKEEVSVIYELQADPGGDLPIWLINGFSSTGIIATFKNLRTWLTKKEPVVNAASFIKD
jgi:hypothetical protein